MVCGLDVIGMGWREMLLCQERFSLLSDCEIAGDALPSLHALFLESILRRTGWRGFEPVLDGISFMKW